MLSSQLPVYPDGYYRLHSRVDECVMGFTPPPPDIYLFINPVHATEYACIHFLARIGMQITVGA